MLVIPLRTIAHLAGNMCCIGNEDYPLLNHKWMELVPKYLQIIIRELCELGDILDIQLYNAVFVKLNTPEEDYSVDKVNFVEEFGYKQKLRNGPQLITHWENILPRIEEITTERYTRTLGRSIDDKVSLGMTLFSQVGRTIESVTWYSVAGDISKMTE